MVDTRGGIVVRDRRHGAVRDPRAATITTGWAARGLPMVPEWDAAGAVRLAYLSNSIVYRCVRVTADALSRVPFRVGADPDKPSSYTTRAPLAQLLGPAPGGPNPSTSSRRLWAWTIAQYLVTGRWCWETELSDDSRAVPVGLWPLPATQLRAVASPGGARYFDRFLFGPAHDPKKLTPEQVVYGWRPSQTDWREPESLLQAARLDVSVAVMQDRYDYAFLRNGSRPDFMVVTPPFAEDDQSDAFRAQFQAEHRGPENAGKPAFLEADPDDSGRLSGVEIKQLGLSQKDSEAIERYRQKIAAICVVFGTPMSKLGDASGRTFSNASQEDRNWWEDTLLPLGEELADEVNTQLAPRLGSDVGWFDWSAVRALRPEPRFQNVGVPELVAGKVVTLDEGRAMLDLPSVTGGDVLDVEGAGPDVQAAATAFATLVQAGVAPDSAAAQVGLPGIVMAPPPAEPEPAPVVPAQATGAGRAPEEQETRDGEHDDPLAARLAMRDARWKAVNDRAEQQEKTWTRAMRRLFGKQETSTLARLTGKRGRQLLAATRAAGDDPAPEFDPTDLFDPQFWQDETAEVTHELLEPVALTAGGDLAGQFGLSFDLEAPYVQEFVRARANQLSGQVTDTTYSAIRDALAAGVAEGDDIDALAARIRHVFTVAFEARAVTIARTEVISAYNGASLLTAAQLGADVVAGKEWIATRDSRTREEHADADGQTVAIDAPFTVMGEDVLYPGDGSAANVVNCRCTVAYLTPDEMTETDRSRARAVDVRLARFALDLVASGQLAPEDLRARLQVVA